MSLRATEKRHVGRYRNQNRSPCLYQIRSFLLVVVVVFVLFCTQNKNDYFITIFTFTKIISYKVYMKTDTSDNASLKVSHFLGSSSLYFVVFEDTKSLKSQMTANLIIYSKKFCQFC